MIRTPDLPLHPLHSLFVLVRPRSVTLCVLWPSYSRLNIPHKHSSAIRPASSLSHTCERGEWILFSDSHRASPANWPVLAQQRARSHVEDISVMTPSPTPVCDKEKQFVPINTEGILAPVHVASREFRFFYSFEASGMARCTFVWVYSKHAPCL